MKSQFRHIALIGKTHATLVGSALSASRQVMDKLTHFLHDQGCDVAIERETAAHLGMSGHQELDVKGIGADCDLAWWWAGTAPCWALAANWPPMACR